MKLNLETTGIKVTNWSIIWNQLTIIKVTIKQTTTRGVFVEEYELWSLKNILSHKKWHLKNEFWTTLEHLRRKEMSVVKAVWDEVTKEVQTITGKSWEESMTIARPLADDLYKKGYCELPDGRRLELKDVKL